MDADQPDRTTSTSAATTEHDLPMLRVHRAQEAAEKIAEAHGIDRGIALAIARKTIDIIGDGTKRWGHICTTCRSLIAWQDGEPVCPEHGRLGHMAPMTLLISFEPVST